MKRRTLLAGAATAATPLLAGCGGGGDGGDDGSEPVISVSSTGYDPRKEYVDPGTTVTWVNENTSALSGHTVTAKQIVDGAEEWEFDERLSREGDEVSYTFEESGIYTYVGTVKGEDCMCGAILVGDADYGEPMPCTFARGGGCR